MYKHLVSCVTIVVIFAGIACSEQANVAKPESAWPGWRGPNRDGKSPDTDLIKSWPEGGPKQLWHTQGIGKGYSNASVGGGKVYTTGVVNKELHMFAFDMTGKKVWDITVGPGWGDGSRSTPMYDEDNLYIETGHGLVGCYSAGMGEKKWTRELKEWGGQPHGWGHSESVLILGDLAIVTPGGDACIVALNKKTGTTVWESEKFAQSNYSSPTYMVHDGVPMIVNGTHGGILGVHAETGKILWKNDFCKGNTANCPTPAYGDGYVFWSNGYGKGSICLKLTKTDEGVKAEEVWRNKEMVCHHGGFVILGEYIYGNHDDGWSCLELKTGKTVWNGRGVGKGSMCYADGMLYLFGEKEGRVGLAKAVTDGLEMCGEFSVKGSGPSWAHPTVADGRLYLRYAENLYCFDIKAK